MKTIGNKASRWLVLVAVLLGAVSQAGCLALAAGAAGGVVGHEIAKEEDDDE